MANFTMLQTLGAAGAGWAVVAAALAALLVAPASALGQSAENVLVVINAASPASVEVGEYYATKRAIPASQVVRLKTATVETIARQDYESSIEVPIGAWLNRNALQDRILYIVLTKGVPIRIAGTGGRQGTVSSVDSELTLLYRKLLGQSFPVLGMLDNPLFLADRDVATAQPITRFNSEIYLVTRLDGFTTADAKALVDRSLAAERAGTIVLDQKSTLIDRGGDQWLQTAAERLKSTAVASQVALENSQKVATATGPVLGYFSWGSNDPANQLRRFGLTFAPGAIGGMFVSSDGRTFVEPPATWKPSPPNGGPVFRGSFQSLAADLIRDGITGVSGHVDEPFLDATVRPQILFPAYVAGFGLAESFYLSIPFLSWQTIVIGDPLCRPFAGKTLSPAEISKAIDPETELPGIMSERRLALLTKGGLNEAAVKLFVKKQAQVARGEVGNAEALLVKATELEPKLVIAHLELASLYDERKDYPKAVERYRRILAVEADNVPALNNLAYALATELGNPKEALTHAEHAYRLAKTSGPVADTLGWIHHLLGNDRTATFFLEQAVRALPLNPDVLIHAATVHVALNEIGAARAEFLAAEKLGPPTTERDDFKVLRDRLKR